MPAPEQSPLIAGSVLPIQKAEELLATLPGVISARIVAAGNGAVEEIHLLTTDEVTPKQCVRNVESALIAHLGMRVSHKKISVAMSTDPTKMESMRQRTPEGALTLASTPAGQSEVRSDTEASKRRLYFEDVEVRRSRTKGVACRVTLKKGEQSFVGEAEGVENERLRVELAARAALQAIGQAVGEKVVLALEGCRTIEAFDRGFVFVGIMVRAGRDTMLLTGSAEIRESPETSSVLAVLDATNRWIDYSR